MAKEVGQTVTVSNKYTGQLKQIVVTAVYKNYFVANLNGKTTRFNYKPSFRMFEAWYEGYHCK